MIYFIIRFVLIVRYVPLFADDETVNIFEYGERMKEDNMKKVAPNVAKLENGILLDHRFDFTYDEVTGHLVNVAYEQKEEEIQGVVWSLSKADAESFESAVLKQNSVQFKDVSVKTPTKGDAVACRTVFAIEIYQPKKKLVYGQGFPVGKRPEKSYMRDLLMAAVENNLPKNYMKKLQTIPTIEAEKQKVLYAFVYASYMKSDVMKAKAPSAEVDSIAELLDVEIKSASFIEALAGCVYTISPNLERTVWGVVWKISTADLHAFEHQTGVYDGWYEEIQVSVRKADGTFMDCITVQQQKLPETAKEECPSTVTYYQEVIDGATEHGLPDDYINSLKNLPHK